MKEQIKAKEPVNLYRMLSLVAITLDSIGVMCKKQIISG